MTATYTITFLSSSILFAGGPWNGLRMNYNFGIEDIEGRKAFRVRNELGACIEVDCDMHIAKDLSLHCKKISDEFDSDTFNSLWTAWWKGQGPRTVIAARKRLVDFIEDQVRKDVKSSLQGLYNFYSREGERVLHFFRDPTANLSEALNSKDNKSMGTNLSVSEAVRLEICSFLDQCSRLRHLGECGYERREGRVQELYQQRRANLAAAKRAKGFADDIMEDVREVYVTAEPEVLESRNHRADKNRTFPRRPTAQEQADFQVGDKPQVSLATQLSC